MPQRDQRFDPIVVGDLRHCQRVAVSRREAKLVVAGTRTFRAQRSAFLSLCPTPILHEPCVDGPSGNAAAPFREARRERVGFEYEGKEVLLIIRRGEY
jgi:hypothetical protein